MRYRFLTCDVFTERRFGGNQLAVLPDAEGLDAGQMQAIAAEFNYSETTFVLPPTDPAHLARVRIFTPRFEMPFAGHPDGRHGAGPGLAGPGAGRWRVRAGGAGRSGAGSPRGRAGTRLIAEFAAPAAPERMARRCPRPSRWPRAWRQPTS